MKFVCQSMQLLYLFYQPVLSVANCIFRFYGTTSGNFAVVFHDDLWLILIIWRIWFFKVVKLFCQFLMENFGELVMPGFVIIWG
jgi:hypothetical protein